MENEEGDLYELFFLDHVISQVRRTLMRCELRPTEWTSRTCASERPSTPINASRPPKPSHVKVW